MTKKLYLADMETLSVEAVVTSIDGGGQRPHIRVSQTVFHPQGGGQRPDVGMIGNMRVVDVQHNGNDVDHFVDSLDQIEVGQTVLLGVDPEVRLTNSRYHSAGHLIAALLEQRFAGCAPVAGHHYPGEARVEAVGELPEPQMVKDVLPNLIDEASNADFPIRILGHPFESRLIGIGAFRPLPCGGTHVNALSKVGRIVVTNVRVKQGRLRVSYGVTP